ncbi:MAG: class F sortase [Nocardiaceae bacterium]|nr:class F sortase [Nocardiaceae bacterium]
MTETNGDAPAVTELKGSGVRVATPVVAISLGALLLGVWASAPGNSATAAQTGGLPVMEQTAIPIVAPDSDTSTAAIPFVPQGEPLWIEIGHGILSRTGLNPDGVKAIDGRVVPVDNRPVWRSDSNEPGSHSPGTAFIVGHNYADASGEIVPFAALEKVRVGNTVTVGVPDGELTYKVQQVFKVPKKELANRTDLLTNVEGRLILETCDTTPEGGDTYDNLVVITKLVDAQPYE